jgi:hypothetical protein
MSASLLSRLRRLEKAQDGPCPLCARPLLVRGIEQAAPRCPACGREPSVVRLIRDRNFFGNADRLPASG